MSSIIRQEQYYASGDGTEIYEKRETPFSTPIKVLPLSSEITRSNSAVYLKSNNKAQSLATHPNITRRKALTLAEFNPSRRVNRNCKRELRLSTEAEPMQVKKKVAGRRVYQVLLLNAWRKRRNQTKTLLDSKKVLELQNSKLELQIEALHRFRNAESAKREEAVSNLQHLEQQLQDNLNHNKLLLEEKTTLEHEMNECEQFLSDLQLERKSAKNELKNKSSELVTKKCQLGVEQNKTKSLTTEINMSVTQSSIMEVEISKLCNEVEDLQKQLFETELKLQDTLFNNNNFESENKELLEKLNNETVKRKVLEEHNANLKSNLTLAQADLSKELNRGLWKNAEGLMLSCLKSLKTIAVTMLPALPENVFEKN